MSYDSLGDRMKRHEKVAEHYLMRRTPVIIRIDGKAFHTLTKNLNDRFDSNLHNCMVNTMRYLCENIQGAVLGYTQSDEISILIRDWDTIKTESWFDYRQNKMESVSASMATMAFNKTISLVQSLENKSAMFDARAFNLPTDEVVNYMVWRQQDAERNSVQMYGQTYFSHKELQGKSNPEVITMLDNIGHSWQQLDTWKKRGTCWVNPKTSTNPWNGKVVFPNVDKTTGIDENIPVFTKDRQYVDIAMRYIDILDELQ